MRFFEVGACDIHVSAVLALRNVVVHYTSSVFCGSMVSCPILAPRFVYVWVVKDSITSVVGYQTMCTGIDLDKAVSSVPLAFELVAVFHECVLICYTGNGDFSTNGMIFLVSQQICQDCRRE